MIPKVMNFYWGKNKNLSYMRYLSIKSFCNLNPDWKVIIHSPSISNKQEEWSTREQKSLNPIKDYFNCLTNIKNILFKTYDNLPQLSEVQRSDILRLFILASGGFYSDSDILYVSPMESFLQGIPEGSKAILCVHPVEKYHSIGFLGASKDNMTFKNLFELSKEINENHYQSYGACLYFSYLEDGFIEPTYNMPFEVVYPVTALETIRLFQSTPIKLSDKTIGIHWFGGDVLTSRYENNILDSNINTYNNYLINLMKEVV